MTGRELILYILENNLEDELISSDGRFLDFTTVDEAAAHYGVGTATIKTWIDYGWLSAIHIGNEIYIPKNAKFMYGTNQKGED